MSRDRDKERERERERAEGESDRQSKDARCQYGEIKERLEGGRARSSSPGRGNGRSRRGPHRQSTSDHQSPTSRTGYSAPGIYLPSTKPVDLTFLGVEIT